MAENILKFQAGREAPMAGKSRDRRRSADWLEGFDQEARPELQPYQRAMARIIERKP